MTQSTYKIHEGSLHEKFQASRAKLQMFAGGFGNGKSTGAIIKALMLAKDYPGSNGLVARATFPKLDKTIRKDFKKWIPASWIKRDVNSKENLIELKNGSVINFSYVAQGGKAEESSTSNLLSATYDWIVVDQIEDPEITHKDFLDLLGRLRGNTTYQGDDETMPTSGPRWFIMMCNPTRNWVYRELVKPLQDYAIGIKNPRLLWDEEKNRPLMDLFEGSTYENKENLPEDFIATQEAAYKGQMRSRFLMGEWGAYEGLVYPQYDPTVHIIEHDAMLEYFNEIAAGYTVNLIEAYDHGIAKQACYGFAFTDPSGNVFVLDGLYEKEKTVKELAKGIKKIRGLYGVDDSDEEQDDAFTAGILADPSIFRRVSGNSRTVGTTTAGMFKEHKLKMVRANNDILNGIAKVQSYLAIDEYHRHPITGNFGAPRLYVSDKCSWFDTEITDYYWKKDSSGEYDDIPMDRNDHAMDMIKYLLTNRPKIATAIPTRAVRSAIPVKYRRWRETENTMTDTRAHRYG